MKPILLFVLCLAACRNTPEKKPATPVAITCMPPATTDAEWYRSNKKAPLLPDLGGIDFVITTKSTEAQQYFNQGLMLSYGFNHAEAARSFYQAIRLDSSCAMCYWGYAYVLGPNYNAGMEKDNYERAYAATLKAQQYAAGSTAKEQALIKAISLRYAAIAPEDRKPLDVKYSEAMKSVFDNFSQDPDIGALYAESVMDMHPWDLYDKVSKTPKPWTPALYSLLEKLMTAFPKHPGAHHFYIHAAEASAQPEKALASARLLETLVPGSGHLVHMPSHIYINTGDYHAGSLSNIEAIKRDSIYTTACHAQGAYPLAYYPHNEHFLAATATLEGNKAWAWRAAQHLQANTSVDVMRQPGWGTLQHYYSIPYHIAIKFGMWDTLIALPSPPVDLIYPQAMWHYARGMAFAGKRQPSEARQELAQLKALAADSTLATITIWDINSAADIVRLSQQVLEASILAQNQQYSEAIGLLEEAVKGEDALNYNEPPDWFFSVRHHLGTVLLQAKQYTAAEKVFEADLRTWKENGWALKGLYLAQQAQHKKIADETGIRFQKAWRFADTSISNAIF